VGKGRAVASRESTLALDRLQMRSINSSEETIMVDALIIDACRTPRGIGKAGKGALAGIHPQQLGATVLRALADRTGIDTADVDDIIWGTSSQRGPQSGDLGRMSAGQVSRSTISIYFRSTRPLRSSPNNSSGISNSTAIRSASMAARSRWVTPSARPVRF